MNEKFAVISKLNMNDLFGEGKLKVRFIHKAAEIICLLLFEQIINEKIIKKRRFRVFNRSTRPQINQIFVKKILRMYVISSQAIWKKQINKRYENKIV